MGKICNLIVTLALLTHDNKINVRKLVLYVDHTYPSTELFQQFFEASRQLVLQTVKLFTCILQDLLNIVLRHAHPLYQHLSTGKHRQEELMKIVKTQKHTERKSV